MRNENRKNEQCCKEKEQKNLEFARELAVEQRRNQKDCGGGCGKR